ncbi:MAG: tetratricopeptide repeat protein [Selenomonadaceae bacterium]|nr:tetratricopeptide repeat protein [Selenomonadaceae bacterium]
MWKYYKIEILFVFAICCCFSLYAYFDSADREPALLGIGLILFVVYLFVRFFRIGMYLLFDKIFDLLRKLINYPSYKEAKKKVEEGVNLYQQKKYSEAILKYDEAIQSYSNFCEVYDNRGLAYIMLEKYNEAIADFKTALKINRKDSVAYSYLGFAYNKLQNYEQAIFESIQAIDIDSKCAMAYHNRGVAYKALGQNAKGEQDLEKARELGYTE